MISGPAPARSGRFSHAWRALRHRNFKLFVAGQSISLIGTWMTRLATSWLVYRLTHSALLLGLVGFAGQILTFVLAPFAGVWVERMDRRRLLVWTQAGAAVQSLGDGGAHADGEDHHSRDPRSECAARVGQRVRYARAAGLHGADGGGPCGPGQCHCAELVDGECGAAGGAGAGGHRDRGGGRGLVLPDRRRELLCGDRVAGDDAGESRQP